MANIATVERPPKQKLTNQEVYLQTAEHSVKNLRTVLRQEAKINGPVELTRLLDIAFVQEFPPERGDNRLANALMRGTIARAKLREDEGGSLSAEVAARLLGISKAAILKRYQKGHIVAWREERQNAVRFPAWQFEDNRVLEGLDQVLRVLSQRHLDDYGRMLFFLANIGYLGGRRPLDCLRKGDVSAALKAAEGYGG